MYDVFTPGRVLRCTLPTYAFVGCATASLKLGRFLRCAAVSVAGGRIVAGSTPRPRSLGVRDDWSIVCPSISMTVTNTYSSSGPPLPKKRWMSSSLFTLA